MDVISYAKAQAVDKRLTDAIAAGNNPSGWMTDRDAINAKLADQNKQSQTIENGVSVINGTLDSPVDVQVKGRTLVSMGNSYLKNGYQFVLADKKTKIRTLGSASPQIQGVAKFIQNIPSNSWANFVNKISGSTIENPHKVYYVNNGAPSTTLQAPNSGPANVTEGTQTHYDSIKTNAGAPYFTSTRGGGGALEYAQALFAFDIIGEVERQIGRIPGVTTADKVAWLKTNLSNVTINWYGYGSGPSGNKATLAHWQGSTWAYDYVYHTNGTVSKLSISMSQQPANPTWAIALPNNIMADGFMYFLAYADVSDGTIQSVLNTDYVECNINITSGAQLDNRPIVTHVSNFENKVSGSTGENPHISKYSASGSVLAPSAFSSEVGGAGTLYSNMATSDGAGVTVSQPSAGSIAQSLFQFDIVQAIERNIGRIPKATLADKVQWCKDNIAMLSPKWMGWGSGPNGYKATFTPYRYSSNDYQPNWLVHTNGVITTLAGTISAGNYGAFIDPSNGMFSLVAYADAAAPIANPVTAPTLSATGTGGTLPTGRYYVRYSWMNSNGETKVSPESYIDITLGQKLQAAVPSYPVGATGVYVYFSQTSADVNAFKGGLANNATTYLLGTPLGTASVVNTTNTANVTSMITTDYVELQIELKQSAVLLDPVLALYQIDDATEYTNILTTWNEAEVLNRYPKVQSVQHLQNPYIVAEGENLLLPLEEWSPQNGAIITVVNRDEVTMTPTVSNHVTQVALNNLVKGQAYTFSSPNDSLGYVIEEYSSAGTWIKAYASNVNNLTFTWSPTTDGNVLKIRSQNPPTLNVQYTIKQPMLTVGSTAKPFESRNPSYLFATAKLGQIGNIKDILFKQDTQWYIKKAVEKDVVLDGSLGWFQDQDGAGFKRFNVPNFVTASVVKYNGLFSVATLIKYNGAILPISDNQVPDDGFIYNTGNLYIRVSDTDTGFGDAYTASGQEVQAYFYGWQAKTVDANGKPTAWRSLGDGTDAPTQTLAYVSVNKAPNFTPYKITYALATPTNVPAAVEGDIALNGLTQVQVNSGVIVREKITSQLNGTGTNYDTNYPGLSSATQWKNRVGLIIDIYKNGVVDTKNWTIVSGYTYAGYGYTRASIAKTSFDTTAEYTATYLVLDRHLLTNNGIEIITNYDASLKSVVDTLVERQSDLMTISGVNVQAIAELYKRVKALGG